MGTRTGYVTKRRDKKWVARTTYTDSTGRRRNVARVCNSKREAHERLRELIAAIDREAERGFTQRNVTFSQAAVEFEQAKLQPATYRGGVKIAGVRSPHSKGYLPILTEFFGHSKLRQITHGDVEDFKRRRLATETRSGKPRAVASVHRELELLRQIFNYSKRRGWLDVTPFDSGEPLIQKSAEVSRDRILLDTEEKKLLAVCTGRLAHLKPLIICGVDSGMRRGELFKLTWADVNFPAKLITIPATITKTLKLRVVGMTSRMVDELWRLYEASDKQPDTLCFGLTDNVKHAWASAIKRAGIVNLRFHDLRHTAVTRMCASDGLSPVEAMRVSGHATLAMISRYINTDSETALRAAAVLETRLQKVG